MTVIGSASATSSIQSPLPRASKSVDHPRRARPDAVFELGDRPRREGTRDELAVLVLPRRVQLMIVGYEANRSAGWISGPSTAVNESGRDAGAPRADVWWHIQKSRLTVLWRRRASARGGKVVDCCRSSVNMSSGKPLRHNAKSDRSTVEAVIRNLDSPRRSRRKGCRYRDSPYRRPRRALTFNA